jgi:hypothetical protein
VYAIHESTSSATTETAGARKETQVTTA